MTIVQALLNEPKEKNWLYPKICRALYILSLISVILYALIGAFVYGNELIKSGFTVVDTVKSVFLSILRAFGIMIIGALCARLWYEMLMLLFRVFESIREMIKIDSELKMKLDNIANVQLQTSQYICDSLAALCDNSQGDK